MYVFTRRSLNSTITYGRIQYLRYVMTFLINVYQRQTGDHKIMRNRYFIFILVNDVTAKVEGIQNFSAKARRILKGHQGKVLCMDWCSDKRHLVSSSQVNCVFDLCRYFKYVLKDF